MVTRVLLMKTKLALPQGHFCLWAGLLVSLLLLQRVYASDDLPAYVQRINDAADAFERTDRTLNVEYRKLRSLIGQREFENLRRAQIEWLAQREMCEGLSSDEEQCANSLCLHRHDEEIWACQTDANLTRISELKDFSRRVLAGVSVKSFSSQWKLPQRGEGQP